MTSAAELNVLVGAEVLLQSQISLLKGKHVGVITNHSALLHDRSHFVDALSARKDVKVVALFGPEHGIRGEAPDRKTIKDSTDPTTGIPVFSLFGKTIKPTSRMLKGIDLLVFDIQDVGARFYTYTTTLALTMEAAAEKAIPYVVLDRPNPIGGVKIEGPIRKEDLKSFVGWLPVPIVHGLTVGEMAQMTAGEGWLLNSIRPKLHVVKMKGWRRKAIYDESDLPWVKPSPSIRTIRTALVYPGTCLIEGTNVSEGRGTAHPFEYLGAPWVDSIALVQKLKSFSLPGVRFEAISFTPRSTSKFTTDSKFEGEKCHGVSLEVIDRPRYQAVNTGMHILFAFQELFPENFQMKQRRIDELIGTTSVRKALVRGDSPTSISEKWDEELRAFARLRRKYLLYR